MRLVFTVVFASLAFAVSPVPATEWREFGPTGGFIVSMTWDAGQDQLIAASAPGTIYRSTDEGATWTAYPPLPGGHTCQAAVFCGGSDPVLLAATQSGGVFRWTASLPEWSPSNAGLTPNFALQTYALAVRDATASRVFLGTAEGLYVSEDAGAQWSKVPLPADRKPVTRIEAATDGSVYVYARTPIRVEPNLTDTALFVARPGLPPRALDDAMIWPNPANPDDLALLFDQVYRSTDRGETWSSLAPATAPSELVSAAWVDESLIVFGSMAAHEYEPQDDAWEPVAAFTASDHYGVLKGIGQKDLYLFARGRGVWRSADRGDTWMYASTGMAAAGEVRAVVSPENATATVYVGLAAWGVWRTLDDGETWEERNAGIDPDPAYGVSIRALALDPRNADHLLAGIEQIGGVGTLYRSTDGGLHWNAVPTGPPAIVHRVLFSRNAPGTVLVATRGRGVWRSTDNAATWTEVPGFPQYSNINALAEETGGRLFAAQEATFNTQGGVWISNNQGASWTFDESPGGFRSIAADPARAGRLMAGWPGAGMAFSADNGATWPMVNSGLRTVYGNYGEANWTLADPGRPGTWYVSLQGNGVYQTLNDGGEWTLLADWFDHGNTTLAWTARRGGTLFMASGNRGLRHAQLAQPFPTLTPTPTATPAVTATPTPPPWFPTPKPTTPTPTPTPGPQVNVGVEDGTLWSWSAAPFAGDSISAGVRVYNNGRTSHANLPVRFHVRSGDGNWSPAGTATLPSLPARTRVEVECPNLIPLTAPGAAYLKAVVDEDNLIDEFDETDNQTQIALHVRQAGADTVAPTGAIRIAGGSLFTPWLTVDLDLEATDNDAVAWMFVSAWSFDPAANDIALYYESGWIPWSPYATFELLGRHVEFLTVNYADVEGNVSERYWAPINYYPSGFPDVVWYDEIRYTPMYLTAGAPVSLTLNVDFGDPDLYVIAPSTPPGMAAWVSASDGSVPEGIQFIAPESGFYWAAVFGYDFAMYTLTGSSASDFKAESPVNAAPRPADRRAPELAAPGAGIPFDPIRSIPSPGLDLTGDGRSDFRDLFTLAQTWGLSFGEPGYDGRVAGSRTDIPISPPHLIHWISARRIPANPALAPSGVAAATPRLKPAPVGDIQR